MKAIQGRDSFYLVQKAYKFEPSAEQSVRVSRQRRVCDTRLPTAVPSDCAPSAQT